MKCPVILILFMIVAALPAAPVSAAELLDVKPVASAAGVVVEILADTPMTYSCHMVPGQARAVVDIADVDPEKIEPLIVVNKGAVSSVSVDKTQKAGTVVSRLIFNLVSGVEISITASADRKKLAVAFGGGKPAGGGTEKPAVLPSEAAPAPQASLPPAPVVAPAAAKKEADLSGQNERAATVKNNPAAGEADAPAASHATSAPTGSVKLEPVVPVAFPHRKAMTITAITVGTAFIDIRANGCLDDFTQFMLNGPNRLVIDVPGTATSLARKIIPVRRFGVVQARVGQYPDHTRIVFDAGTSPFPTYEVKATDMGLRISFR